MFDYYCGPHVLEYWSIVSYKWGVQTFENGVTEMS